jgi:hypothetical protein
MRPVRALRLTPQLDLFPARPQQPDWQGLPIILRQQTVKLLAQLLCEQQHRCGHAESDTEVGDE